MCSWVATFGYNVEFRRNFLNFNFWDSCCGKLWARTLSPLHFHWKFPKDFTSNPSRFYASSYRTNPKMLHIFFHLQEPLWMNSSSFIPSLPTGFTIISALKKSDAELRFLINKALFLSPVSLNWWLQQLEREFGCLLDGSKYPTLSFHGLIVLHGVCMFASHESARIPILGYKTDMCSM